MRLVYQNAEDGTANMQCYKRTRWGYGGSNPPLSAKQSAISALFSENPKIARMRAYFLRPEGTGEA